MSRTTTPTYVLLNQITLAANSSSVTFSGIPNTYRDLVLVFDGLLSTSSTYNIQVNADSANHYSVWAYGNSNNNGVGSLTQSNSGQFPLVIYTGTPASGRINCSLQFLDYSAIDKHKTAVMRTSGTHEVGMTAGRYGSTNAITSLRMFTSSTFVAGSTFSLYGLVA